MPPAAEAPCPLPGSSAAPAPKFPLCSPAGLHSWQMEPEVGPTCWGTHGLAFPSLDGAQPWFFKISLDFSRNFKVTCAACAEWCPLGSTMEGVHGHLKAAATQQLLSPLLLGDPNSSHLQLPEKILAWERQSETAHGVLQNLYQDLCSSQRSQ